MEKVTDEWKDMSKKIENALEFLDTYFREEHLDDKTANEAYCIVKACAKTYLNLGNRLSGIRKGE